MRRAVLFAGTGEGREIAEFCERKRIPILVCVATEYGASLLPQSKTVTVRTGRMDEREMTELFWKETAPLVIDATHPYAELVSRNLRKACEETGKQYRRVLRRSENMTGCVVCRTVEEVIEKLNDNEKPILLTVGSKLLPQFTQVKDYDKRCAVRLLPSGVETALHFGFLPERIISGKGPFSEEETIEQLRRFQAKILVTKESGQRGGFREKIQAANACGALPLVLARPAEETGSSLEEICKELEAME